MQAHPQSTSAARIPLSSQLPALSSRTTRPTPISAIPPQAPPQPKLLHLIPPVSSSIAHATGLAHDAGNLLGALGLYCDLLRAPGVLRPEHSHYAAELNLISSRSTELIQRLLASPFQVPGPAPDALNLQPAAVRRRDPLLPETSRTTYTAILRNLAPVLDRIAAGSARVVVFTPTALPAINDSLTAETLERITVNLVRNAAEAIRFQRNSTLVGTPIGEVRVTFAVAAGRLQLTVEDTGPGIPPGIAAAFLRPAPLPPGTRRGFGHRIVHELVTASRGRLSIRVRPGLGSAFCIKWPISGAPLAPISIASAHVQPAAQKGPTQC